MDTEYDEGSHALDLLRHLREKANAKGYSCIESAIDAAKPHQTLHLGFTVSRKLLASDCNQLCGFDLLA